MKKIYIAVSCLFVTGLSFAQPMSTGVSPAGKIKLVYGQKIVVENSIDVEASLIMGIQLNGNLATINLLEVKNTTDKESTISSTLTKLKVKMNMMGEPNNYDSENKEGNNEEMAKIFDERMNKPVDIIIDNSTGASFTEKKEATKQDADDINLADEMMKMFSNNSDDAIVSGAFAIIPQGKSTGDTWSDTTTAKDLKVIRKYTLSAVSGNEATIQADILSNSANKVNYQGTEIQLKTATKTKAEIITEINTGLVKKRTSTADISGSIPMMGQDMPISAKVTSSATYK